MRFAAGVPNVGLFGDPLLLTDLAVAAEDSGWDAFFIWDHLLYRDQRWPVADPDGGHLGGGGPHQPGPVRRSDEPAGPRAG